MAIGDMTDRRHGDILQAFQFLTEQGFRAEELPYAQRSDPTSQGTLVFIGEKSVIAVERTPGVGTGMEVTIMRAEDYAPGKDFDWNAIRERGTAPLYLLSHVLNLRPEAREALDTGLASVPTTYWKRGERDRAIVDVHAGVVRDFCADLLAGDFSAMRPRDQELMIELERRARTGQPF